MSTNNDLSEDDLTRSGEKMVRAAFIILGHIPITEQTPEEVEWNLSRPMRRYEEDEDDFDKEEL